MREQEPCEECRNAKTERPVRDQHESHGLASGRLQKREVETGQPSREEPDGGEREEQVSARHDGLCNDIGHRQRGDEGKGRKLIHVFLAASRNLHRSSDRM